MRRVVMNGLTSAGRELGDENLFDQSKWEYVGRYNEMLRELYLHDGPRCTPHVTDARMDVHTGRYEFYYRSTCEQVVIDPKTTTRFYFVEGEVIRVALSHKV